MKKVAMTPTVTRKWPSIKNPAMKLKRMSKRPAKERMSMKRPAKKRPANKRPAKKRMSMRRPATLVRNWQKRKKMVRKRTLTIQTRKRPTTLMTGLHVSTMRNKTDRKMRKNPMTKTKPRRLKYPRMRSFSPPATLSKDPATMM